MKTFAILVVLLIGPASVEAFDPGEGRAPDVVELWSARITARVDRSLAEAERAVEQMRNSALPIPHSALEGGDAVFDSEFRIPHSALQGGQYEQLILSALQDAGLPPDLLAVPFVESRFNPSARSPKGALGLWQLMPGTARRFGLNRRGQLDERLDPARSTSAAVRYLKELYERWRDWPLALAAYNAGEGRVQAALARSGVADFWTLAARGLLPKETREYVPAVLAAARRLSLLRGTQNTGGAALSPWSTP
ncbi:MAG: lytic transglycosylase domain-containing protein [Gammaproteobacteria bacterium]